MDTGRQLPKPTTDTELFLAAILAQVDQLVAHLNRDEVRQQPAAAPRRRKPGGVS